MKWRTMSFHFRHKMKWSSQLHGWEGPQRSIAGDLLLEKKEDWFFFLTSTMSFYWYDQTDPNSAEAGDCHANNPLQKNTSISLRTVQASLSKSYLPIPLSAFWAEATSSRPCISLRFSEAPSSLSTPPGDSFEQGPERWTVRHCPTAEWSLRSVDLSQWHETPPGLPWLKAGRSRKMVHMVAWCHSFVWV